LAVIEVEGLVKRFGRVTALRGVSFEVRAGSAMGLLGPNGAGKTTTLKVLVGLLRPTSGSVRVLGLDPWRRGGEVRSRVGVLHERPSYPRRVTALRLLEYAARMRGLGPEDVRRAVRLTGLAQVAERRVSALSRGYLQRLGLALAIMGDPEVLLLDEPTANLDPAARSEVLDLISTLKGELDVTLVVSSHIIPELEEVCDSAAFISGGRILDYGTLEELARRHASEARLVVEADRPREVASALIETELVRAVEVDGREVRVRVAPGGAEAVEALLSRLPGVRSVRHAGAGLMDLYGRVVLGEGSGEAV